MYKRQGLWMSWPKGQGQTLCAALEPIVEALQPAAPQLELIDLEMCISDRVEAKPFSCSYGARNSSSLRL